MLGFLDEEDGQYSHGAEQKPVLALPFRLGEYPIPVMLGIIVEREGLGTPPAFRAPL